VKHKIAIVTRSVGRGRGAQGARAPSPPLGRKTPGGEYG